MDVKQHSVNFLTKFHLHRFIGSNAKSWCVTNANGRQKLIFIYQMYTCLFIYLFIFGTDFAVTSCRDLSVGDAVLNYQNLGSCRQDLSDGLSHARLTTHLIIHQCPSHHASLYSPIPVSPRISLFTDTRLTARISLFTNARLTTCLFIHQCPSHHASLYSPMSVSPRVSLFTSRVLWSRVCWKQSKQHCPY